MRIIYDQRCLETKCWRIDFQKKKANWLVVWWMEIFSSQCSNQRSNYIDCPHKSIEIVFARNFIPTAAFKLAFNVIVSLQYHDWLHKERKKNPKDYLYQFTYFLSWHRTLSQTIPNNLQPNICCTENRSTMSRTGFTKQIYWYLRQCTGTDHIIENLWRFLEKEGF